MAVDTLRLMAFSRPLALVAAEREGFLAAEALAIEYSQSRGSAPQIAALLAGELDVVHTAVDNVVLRVDRDGADLVMVLVAELGISQRLVVRADIESIADLRGQTLGVDAVDSGYATLLYAMLERRGVRRDAYRVLSVGGTSERLEALLAGKIAGGMLGTPHDLQALAAGARSLASASDEYPGYPALGVAAKRTWAGAHRDLVARYSRALVKGARWAADPANRDRGIELLAADGGVSLEMAAGVYEAEARSREVAAPTLEQQRASVARVVELRHPGEAVAVQRYFEPA
jgi:ABC-type nitrate/sulfonate/bicarbonate transport system substrate-binding protein